MFTAAVIAVAVVFAGAAEQMDRRGVQAVSDVFDLQHDEIFR